MSINNDKPAVTVEYEQGFGYVVNVDGVRHKHNILAEAHLEWVTHPGGEAIPMERINLIEAAFMAHSRIENAPTPWRYEVP